MNYDGSCLTCGETRTFVSLCVTGEVEIVECPDCGLVRTWPPRTPEQLARLHQTPEYFAHPYFDARRDPDRLQAKHLRVLQPLCEGHETADKRLLDVGCDTGAILVTARNDLGMNVVGIDVSAESARIAATEHDLRVHVGQLHEVAFEDDSFDFITVLDVIEHTTDPRALLSEIHRILAPGGRAYIATADHDSLLNTIGVTAAFFAERLFRPLLRKLYIPVHEFYFTKSTLASISLAAGFDIRSHQNAEFPLDEFGHGWVLKTLLRPLFAMQAITGRQTLQEVILEKPPATGITSYTHELAEASD